MNEEATTGIVLRTYPLTETSLIAHWLTADFGRLATVAKGARRPKSPFRGKLDLFYEAEFSFVRSRSSQLHNLREVSLRDTHQELRREMAHLQQCAYCAALVEQATETETPMPEVFRVFDGLLKYVPMQQAQPLTIMAFEVKLLEEMGLSPAAQQGNLSAGAGQILRRVAESSWDVIARLRPSAAQTSELSRFLRGFLVYHLGKHPANRGTALAMHETGGE